MHNISIFGTSSDVGKSTLTFVIAKILQKAGFSVAVFKAQNVSNNSKVTDDLSEIAIAQHFQAEVLGIKTSYHLNPILLKSGKGSTASLIVEGKVVKDKDVKEYYRDLELLKPSVDKCFNYLAAKYDCVVCEGAGSPVELNLMNKDLSNIYIATKFKTKIILVADIQKGGVFASIWGVYNLLPKELQENVIGVIVNKFQGDMSLFDEGVRIIEEEFNIPVFGVLPYCPLNLGFEDSQSLKNFTQDCSVSIKKVAVINYPHMSNYNDFEPLIANKKICLEFVTSNIDLVRFDLIILPGSKLVIKDLNWLKNNGLFDQIKQCKQEIFGICGGYEMMFKNIIDDNFIETEKPTKVKGFGFIDDNIVFEKKKILKKDGPLFEIHHGNCIKYPNGYKKGNISGTFSHSIFDDAQFQKYKEKTITEFIDTMKQHLNIDRILKSVS